MIGLCQEIRADSLIFVSLPAGQASQMSGNRCCRLEVVAESVAGRQNLMQLHMCRSFDMGDGDGRPLLYAQVNVRFFDGGDVLLLLFSLLPLRFACTACDGAGVAPMVAAVVVLQLFCH